MADQSPVVRQVDLRGCAAFAQALVSRLRARPELQVLPVLRAGVRATCPQCQLRLFGEDVLALAASEAPDPDVSPKLHRLSQGFCGRQGCEALFYEFTFDPAPEVDWAGVLAETDADLGTDGQPVVAAEEARQAAGDQARRRTRLRVGAGLGLVVVLLLIRHLVTGGTIPFLREAEQFKADPKTVPRLGETNIEPPAPRPGRTNGATPFRAAPPPSP